MPNPPFQKSRTRFKQSVVLSTRELQIKLHLKFKLMGSFVNIRQSKNRHSQLGKRHSVVYPGTPFFKEARSILSPFR